MAGEQIQGELLPPEPEPGEKQRLPSVDEVSDCPHTEIVRVGNTEFGKCTQCGDDSFPLEPFDPVVEGLLAKLDDIGHEAKAALHALQQGGTDFTVDDCECEQCKSVTPVIKAMREKAERCSCRLCLLTSEGGALGHSGSCSCKLCRAARGTIQAAQQLKGIIENEW